MYYIDLLVYMYARVRMCACARVRLYNNCCLGESGKLSRFHVKHVQIFYYYFVFVFAFVVVVIILFNHV